MSRIGTVGVVVALALGAACANEQGSSEARVQQGGLHGSAISDQAHAGHNGFFWLPPLVDAPTLEGSFDASQHPVVTIAPVSPAGAAPIATYTMTSGPGSETIRVDPTAQQYVVNWHTDAFTLEPGAIYRVSVLLGGDVAGFIDVDVLASQGQIKNVVTQEYAPLVDGKTLPIKFFLNACGSVFCRALDACHVAGTCDVATVTCSNPLAADGTSCSDGDACTQTDACRSGTCIGSNPVTCTAADQCHVAGVCDPATGVCSKPIVPPGTACNDGNACTYDDACTTEGSCAGAAIRCVSDACETRVCNGTASCTVTEVPNATSYEAGGVCTACACHSPGSASGACDANGNCSCRAGYTGAKCDQLIAQTDLSIYSSTSTMFWSQALGYDEFVIVVPIENLGQTAASAPTSCQLGGVTFKARAWSTVQPGTILTVNSNQAAFQGPRSALPATNPQVATCSFDPPLAGDQNAANNTGQVTVNIPSAPTVPSMADVSIIRLDAFECSSLVSLSSYQYSPPVAGQAVCLNLYVNSSYAQAWQLTCTVDGNSQTIAAPYYGGTSFSAYEEFNFGVLGAGAHSVTCTADSGNTVIEKNESNNTATKSFSL